MSSLHSRYFRGALQVRPPYQDGLIAEILSEEGLYGDGPPHWVEGRPGKPCKTALQADTERRKLVKCLRKHGSRREDATRVLTQLEQCRPGNRCHSGACPCCIRAFQRWLVIAGEQLLHCPGVEGSRFKILSIIPTKAASDSGSLQ